MPEGDGWIHPAYSGALVDGEIWGRGTIDDKGPAIISLFAIKALMDEGMKFSKRVRVIFGCNEETGSKCIEHYLEVDEPISYGVSPDSEFPVIFAEKTINSIELKGKSDCGNDVKLVRLDGGIVINAVPDICTFTIETSKENALKIADEIEGKLLKNSVASSHTVHGGEIDFKVFGKAAHGSIPQCGVNAISYSLDALKDVVDCEFVRIYNTYISTCVHGEKLGCYAHDEYGDIAVNVGLCTFENGEYSIKINSRLPFSTDTNTMLNSIKDTLKCENGVEIVFMSDCCLRLQRAETHGNTRENGQSDRQTPKRRKCPIVLCLFPRLSERVPRTPRTGHARPRPRRSEPKSPVCWQNSHALTPR